MLDEILDFAMRNEEVSEAFYTVMAMKAKAPGVKRIFSEFAAEEHAHLERLRAMREGRLEIEFRAEKIADLKIAEYTVDAEPSDDMTYQEALILAMKKEKAAFRLYTDMASRAEDPGARDLFLHLAQEEAKHKLRFEVEYDEAVLVEG